MYDDTKRDQGVLSMLFRKKIERSCTYCAYGTMLEEGHVLCVKKGLRTEGNTCRKFKYDPCKRMPSKIKALDFSKYDQSDFSL